MLYLFCQLINPQSLLLSNYHSKISKIARRREKSLLYSGICLVTRVTGIVIWQHGSS